VTYDPCKLQRRAERLTHRSLAPKSRFLDELDVLPSTSKAAGLSCLKNPAGWCETRPYSSTWLDAAVAEPIVLLSQDFLVGGSISTMMGIKEREFRPLPDYLSLEELVPQVNFYRHLE
jgi:hypothetical protein